MNSNYSTTGKSPTHKDPAERGDAYRAVRLIYDKSPGRSWSRLNSALQDALSAAITAHLTFLPDDFAAIRKDMNGSCWMGNSEGSLTGERYYADAVKSGHAAACISFEKYAGRPALLWSEDVKTPQRLCIGSDFTWATAGKLTITNIKDGYLVACSYTRPGGFSGRDGRLSIGGFECLNDGKYRQVEEITSGDGDTTTIRFSAPVDNPYERKVARVVKITFDELAAVRKKYEALRRQAIKDIASSESIETLDQVAAELAKGSVPGTYRHFDVEDFREAITAREKALGLDREEQRKIASYAKQEAAELERWVNGGERRYFKTVRLRVSGDRVETSTGQSASVGSVRKSFGPVRNLTVDSFNVVEQTAIGVKVGCTLVPWSEVERLEALLVAHAGESR